ILALFIVTVPAGWAQQAKHLRVFISADMEGIAGVVNADQLGPGGVDYSLFRKLMTDEVNAAIEGALAAGADKITVADSHGNELSILPDILNPTAHLIRSGPRSLGMMEGVDQGFDAALLIGYHASINTPRAVRAHTLSSARYFDVRLNGKHAGEAMLSAAIAGHFGVPVVLVSGDDTMVDEIHKTIDPGIVGVTVKRAIGYESAESVSPQTADTLIRDATTKALGGLDSFRPYVLSNPVTLEITFKNMINAEILAFLPSVTREDGATIRFVGKDILEVERFLQVVGSYDSNK
ncbi:MAG: M55 family metallopeptidase, partial [Candidatus Acidiferrales bacterium]